MTPRLQVFVALLAVVFVAALVFALPSISTKDMAVLARIERAPPHAIIATGNSVVTNVSRCDRDTRTIPGFLQDFARDDVVNASYPGQTFSSSLDYAHLAAVIGRPATLVFFVSLFEFNERFDRSLQEQVFDRVAGGPFATNAFGARFRAGVLVAANTTWQQGFTFEGRREPNQGTMAQTYMEPQHAAMPCPETLGTDHATTRALYWARYLSDPINPATIADLGALSHRLARRRVEFLVVLLPVDYDDLRTLDAALGTAIAARAHEIDADLASRRVDVLDLTGTLPADEFGDRWCACGHMGEAGRRAVARAVGNALERSPVQAAG